MLYQLNYQASWELINLYTFYWYITNSQSGQLPIGVIAQSVEHCTGIVELMVSSPVQASISFQALISQLLNVCITAAMINHIFISFSTVQIYELLIFTRLILCGYFKKAAYIRPLEYCFSRLRTIRLILSL